MIRRLGGQRRLWSEEEDHRFAALAAQGVGLYDIAEQLGRSIAAVQKRAYARGLVLTPLGRFPEGQPSKAT